MIDMLKTLKPTLAVLDERAISSRTIIGEIERASIEFRDIKKLEHPFSVLANCFIIGLLANSCEWIVERYKLGGDELTIMIKAGADLNAIAKKIFAPQKPDVNSVKKLHQYVSKNY